MSEFSQIQNLTKEDIYRLFPVEPDGFERFARAPEEKRQPIIRSAMEEFAGKSYGRASTNEIIRKAGVSKGLLFHYFGDKAGLYRYLMIRTRNLFFRTIMPRIDLSDRDLFRVMTAFTKEKLRAAFEYPMETRFYMNVLQDALPDELAAYRDSAIQTSMNAMFAIEENLDEDLLRSGIDRTKAMKIVNWTMSGLSNEVIESEMFVYDSQRFDEMFDVVDEYIIFLRQLFYK
jgi:AcrR family transcriptional regulator